MRGYEFTQQLDELFRRRGTAGEEIIFRTELGDYVPVDGDIRRLKVETDDGEADGFGTGETVVFLMERGK